MQHTEAPPTPAAAAAPTGTANATRPLPAPAPAPSTLPQNMQGRYRLLRNLGAGGFANVYLAYDNVLDQEVAIKTLRLGLASQNDRDRFLLEARIGAKLRHPNIATVFDIIQTGDGLQMVMEYYPGGTLTERVRGKGPLHLRTAADYARQIAQALAYAHRNNVIHRDVKPANVFLAGEGIVKLGDFGIAAHTDQHEFTQTGMIVGTPLYMAPEQGADSRDVDPRADIYALGLTLYFMLTGRPPRVVDLDLIPEAFRPIIKQSTAQDRTQRMVSAEQFIAMLDQLRLKPAPARTAQSPNGENPEQDSGTPPALPATGTSTSTMTAPKPASAPDPLQAALQRNIARSERHYLPWSLLFQLALLLVVGAVAWAVLFNIPGIGFYNRMHPQGVQKQLANQEEPETTTTLAAPSPTVDFVLNGKHVQPGYTTTTMVGNQMMVTRVVQKPAATPTPTPEATPATTPEPAATPSPAPTLAATATPEPAAPAASNEAILDQAFTQYLAGHQGIASALELLRDQGGSNISGPLRERFQKEAEATLLDAANKAPADPMIHLIVGLMYARSGRAQQAQEQLTRAILLDRQSATPLPLTPEGVQGFINRQAGR